MQKFTNVFTIFCSAVISLLSLLPSLTEIKNDKSINDIILRFFSENKFLIGTILAVSILFVCIVNELVNPKWSDRFTHEWTKNFLNIY